MALLKLTKTFPRDGNMLKFLYAKYLNDTHREVITEEHNDEYLKDVFDELVKHHSLDCTTHLCFSLGSTLIDEMIRANVEALGDITGDPKQMDAIRDALTDFVDNAVPRDFCEFFDHPCSGLTMDQLQQEIATGSYKPFFNISMG